MVYDGRKIRPDDLFKSQPIRKYKTQISQTQLSAANVTAVQVVPAPGINYAIVPQRVVLHKPPPPAGGVAWTMPNGTKGQLQYGTTPGFDIACFLLMDPNVIGIGVGYDSTVDYSITYQAPTYSTGNYPGQGIFDMVHGENLPLLFFNQAGSITAPANSAPLNVYVEYVITPVRF